ncbi:YwaF family protein [Rossellomorea aquimaris]|uniref:YwaF family protein n=1 Tax=Rossellomorea aquimaris TaxID=189382 RepID=UPI000B14599B|nr:TIGR02206 family membrane protein [Rossellomorea aquimaris]
MGVWGFRNEEFTFELFSLSHVFAITFSIGAIFVLFVFRDWIRTKGKTPLKYGLIVLLVFSEITFQLWYYLHGQWEVEVNLPLQLCSISLYLCTFMLLTKNYRVFEVTFFASMTGAFIAIITPELFFGFPHFRYFQFFLAHLTIVLSCLYMVLIEGYTLTFASLIRALIALNGIAVFVFFINKMVNANYMFLVHKPYNPSPIDYLGPYPYYLLSLEGVAFTLFYLLYLPFLINRKSDKM